MATSRKYTGLEVAVIGMACRFCDSADYREFWTNLSEGKEMIRTFTDEELLASGVSASSLDDPRYIRRLGTIPDKDRFDASFFGYTAEEAAFMDPQIRVFHELCWNALEDAGYASSVDRYKIGLIAGASVNDYWKVFVHSRAAGCSIDPYYLNMISAQNFISALVAYKLNLRGPVFYVDTACSTSLATVHLACRSLLTRDCTLVVTGGISLRSIKSKGYFYQEGGVASKDGHCRTFDAEASGTALGEGGGVVVLKRLQDALKDNDPIYCIIKSTSANNDGSQKVGFTAPSVTGQSECIRNAQKLAGISGSDISYIEAHGTATRLGDPIEIRALNEAFGAAGRNGSCAIGSVKSNLGHLDAAAGVAGLIKTTLGLKQGKIPASLHFTRPNPDIDFDGGPFYVNTGLKQWVTPNGDARYAGINSLGVGGTNVHLILEEAPERDAGDGGRAFQLLTLSGRSKQALVRNTARLRSFLEEHPDTNLADMSYTWQTGRKRFEHRRTIVYQDRNDLLRRLEAQSAEDKGADVLYKSMPVAFVFSGNGSQYVNMGRQLYEAEPAFAAELDRGFGLLKSLSGLDYREILFPADPQASPINEIQHAQPAIFLFGFALASYLGSLGIKPDYVLGHSLGEYIAACYSGVFNLEDALALMVKRGRLLARMTPGAMLTASIPEKEACKYTGALISLAAVNGPGQVVFSGGEADIDELATRLSAQDISCVRLHISRAMHSYLTKEIAGEYHRELSNIRMDVPRIPLLSNLTGKRAGAKEIQSPEYWTRHLCDTVRFSDQIRYLVGQNENTLFIEIGAGHSLTALIRQHRTERGRPHSLNLVRHVKEQENDVRTFTDRLGKLWEYGLKIDWTNYYGGEKRSRLSLPGYSFEPTRYPAEFNLAEVMTSVASNGGKKDGAVVTERPDHDPQSLEKIQRPMLSTAFSASAGETEGKLSRIFEGLFGIESIGVEDNFFELGGDSLKGMMLLRRINREFGTAIGIQDLFTSPTIRQLADTLDSVLWLSNDIQLDNEIRL